MISLKNRLLSLFFFVFSIYIIFNIFLYFYIKNLVIDKETETLKKYISSNQAHYFLKPHNDFERYIFDSLSSTDKQSITFFYDNKFVYAELFTDNKFHKYYFIYEPISQIKNTLLKVFIPISIISILLFILSLFLFYRELNNFLEDMEKINSFIDKSLKKRSFFYFNSKSRFIEINTFINSLNEFVKIIRTQKKNLFKKLYKNNITDLPNRNALQMSLRKKNRDLVLFDIKDFKHINIVFGYDIANQLLKAISYRLENLNLRVFHIDIDRFIVLFKPNTINKELINVILKILEEPYLINNYNILVEFRVAMLTDSSEDDLIKLDLAFSVSKEINTIIVDYNDIKSKINVYKHNKKVLEELREAIENDNIEPFFQPIFDINHKIIKYEVLIRLKSREGKILSPNEFLKLSKSTHFYTSLTKIVFRKSLNLIRKLNIKLSINLSAMDLENLYLREYIVSEILSSKLGEYITFEIVEDEEIHNREDVVQFIRYLKSLGCKIYIDDFGSGYANFDYLLKWDADGVKIDGSLIKNILFNKDSQILVKTIISFAKQKKLDIVAEYVENEEIFKLLKELGINYFQGFYFSRPLKGDEIENYISNFK